jgi:hypothetical protein
VSDAQRAAIVAVARAELGVQKAAKYWRNVLPNAHTWDYPKHWCGAFAMYCVNVGAGVARVWGPRGTGFCFTPNDIVAVPEPGDVAYFDAPYQHHAVVVDIANGKLYTIDGNQGNGQLVDTRIRPVSCAVTYYSIARFL